MQWLSTCLRQFFLSAFKRLKSLTDAECSCRESCRRSPPRPPTAVALAASAHARSCCHGCRRCCCDGCHHGRITAAAQTETALAAAKCEEPAMPSTLPLPTPCSMLLCLASVFVATPAADCRGTLPKHRLAAMKAVLVHRPDLCPPPPRTPLPACFNAADAGSSQSRCQCRQRQLSRTTLSPDCHE